MRLLEQGSIIDILSSDKIKVFEKTLKTEKYLVVNSFDYITHAAAYIAWKSVGGNVLILNPFAPKEVNQKMIDMAQLLDYSNSITITTSGTTGLPKLRSYGVEMDHACMINSTEAMEFDLNTAHLSFVPPFVSGFWNIILPAWYYHKFDLVVGSLKDIRNSLNQDYNNVILTPGIIDQITFHNIDPDLSNIANVCTGSSQVQEKHLKWLSDHKCQRLVHVYGSTETGSPLMYHKSQRPGELSNWVDAKTATQGTRLFLNQDNELIVVSDILCFGLGNTWNTNDVFLQQDHMFLFQGRTHDIAKINGFRINLQNIENTIVKHTKMKDCIVDIQTKMGVEYLVCNYEGDILPSTDVKKLLQNVLSKHEVPLVFKHVNQIKRTSLGKKIRGSVQV